MKAIKFSEEQIRQLDYAMHIAIQYYETMDDDTKEMKQGVKRYEKLRSHINTSANSKKEKPTITSASLSV